MRGEHRSISNARPSYMGSSPHARGARRRRRGTRRGARDHPRMRGEHAKGMPEGLHTAGSSPHARGARSLDSVDDASGGIIPACAGSTDTAALRVTLGKDHPRMRGEHVACMTRAKRCLGSSPHARGAPLALSVPCACHGIIPAYAGSAASAFAMLSACRDHPRIRGEHRHKQPYGYAVAGSSPHARGALALGFARRVLGGIIPACAGST